MSAASWRVTSASRRGSSHGDDVPNQDAVRCASVADSGGHPTLVVAVSDGHGGKRYVRSDIGSQYAVAFHDAAGQYLDGGKMYRLHLPAGIPAKDFWSVVVYDPQTRSLLQTDQRFPSLSSQKPDLNVNPDTSVDIYFGPEPPPGKAANWVQTIPGKGWFVALRLYGPLEPWFDQTWRPGEFEVLP